MGLLKVYSFDNVRLNINPVNVIKRLGGYRFSQSEEWSLLIEKKIREAMVLMEPLLHYTEMELIRRDEHGIELEGGLMIPSRYISRVFKNVFRVTLFIATVGSDITDGEGRDQMERVIFDAIGSEGVESLVRWFHRSLKIRSKSMGYGLTARFSPGYGDFPLSFQSWFVENLDAESMGVKITENFMLIPEKTVTGVIGWRR